MPLHLAQKYSDLIFLQGMHLFSDDTRENASLARVCAKVADQNGLLQSFVQYTVNILDGFAERGAASGFNGLASSL